MRSEGEGGEKCFMRMRLNQTSLLENMQLQIQLISLIHEHVAWAQSSIIEYIKNEIRGMDTTIQQ